jgi:tRNA-dihydrouridine synthase B
LLATDRSAGNLSLMFDHCVIRGVRFAPARFCAPMAGYTHSAFRRLLTELGGHGAAWTEMLAARQILHENFAQSPWLRRRPGEGPLFFQLMARATDPLDRILDRLGQHGVTAVDLNLACDALNVRVQAAGSALWDNFSALQTVVTSARRNWPGILTVKARLGGRRPGWEPPFAERLRMIADAGVDAVTLHPRFFEDKYRGTAQHRVIPWAASLTRLPLIANGDISGPAQAARRAESLRPAAALMIGRMAIAQPWIFAHWDQPGAVDHADIWRRLFQYVKDDFAEPVALRRVQMFTKYFAANFVFGHEFRVKLSKAATLTALEEIAEAFFARSPALLPEPTVAGL